MTDSQWLNTHKLGDFTPNERKYKDVPVRHCLRCGCVLSRYTSGEHCSPCVERVIYRETRKR